MTKKEKEQIEHLKILASFYRTQPVYPDVPPPDRFSDGLSKGFIHNGGFATGYRIEPACSSSVYHGRGQHSETTSQGSLHLFSTKLLALRALRHEVEIECMRKLRSIDRMIESELETA